MRVLMWTENFRTAIGGVEVFVEALVRSLSARGIDVTVVASLNKPGLPEREEFDGIPVYRLPFHAALVRGRADAAMAVRTRVVELKRLHRIQVVYLHTMSASAFFHLESSRAWPAPVLLTMHGGPQLPHRNREPATIAKGIVDGARWICCCSHAVRAQLVAAQGPEALAQSSVVYCGIEEPAIVPLPRPIAEPRLLCLGRLVELKGFEIAIAAFAHVLARWPTARLIVAGDGPTRGRLEAQAAMLGVSRSVEFTGWVEPGKTAALINTATVVLVPSRRESLGLVAVEAALLERPVVASRVEGLPEVVDDGVTGFLVPPDDTLALADAVLRLLERPELADEIGRAGRRLARKRFGWTRCVDEYESLYRRVMEDTRNGTREALAAE